MNVTIGIFDSTLKCFKVNMKLKLKPTLFTSLIPDLIINDESIQINFKTIQRRKKIFVFVIFHQNYIVHSAPQTT